LQLLVLLPRPFAETFFLGHASDASSLEGRHQGSPSRKGEY
jgi:hypothetical protein